MSKHYEGRRNTRTAASVDEALQAVQADGRWHVARVMSARGVPFSVTVRVLSEGDERRRSSAGLKGNILLNVQGSDGY
jgi:hypothetical protein